MDELITLDHGAGGLKSQELILHLLKIYGGIQSHLEDSASIELGNNTIAFTTDSFVVDPIIFSGGNIGKLAVCGTINDLASAGARPLYLSIAMVLEESLPIDILETISRSIAQAAEDAEVKIVTGDTKVVRKGEVDKIIINSTGIGLIPPGVHISISRACPGDLIAINGYVGDHGISILSLREGLGFEQVVLSDCTPLNSLVSNILNCYPDIHVIRDATRGGIATVLNEMATASNVGINIFEKDIPIRQEVQMASDLLGLSPLYLANEGKIVMAFPGVSEDIIMGCMKNHPLGKSSAVIGQVVDDHPGHVVLMRGNGARTILPMLVGNPLPRLC